MTSMTSKTGVQKNPDVIVDKVDGTTMFCNTTSVEFYRTNELGAFLWESCEEHSPEELEAILCRAYPSEDKQRVSSEVRRTLALFREAGLIIIAAKAEG